jgi:hypothetical protein
VSEEPEPVIEQVRRLLRPVNPYAPEPTLEELLRRAQADRLLPEKEES